MAQPILLPPAFDGMVQDFPRNALPKGRCWNLVDFIPQALGAPLTERGGWAFASPAFTAVDASAASVRAGVEAPFTGGVQLVTIDDLGNLVKIVGGVNTKIAAAGLPVQNPFMHQQLVVIPSPDGTTAPKKYDGTTVAALGASAPAGKYGCVFVNYTWLAGVAATPQRAFASNVGDPTTFVTSGVSASTLDAQFSIVAMAALPNVMLWFGSEQTARVRGTTPPPGTDMQIDSPIFNYGCIDARSVQVNGSFASFANTTGVFLTNGTATPEDLTKSCGISKYWRDLLSTYSAATWTVSAGWFGSMLLVTVMNGTTLVDTIAFDTTAKRAAIRFSNLAAACYFAAGSAGQELYAGSRVLPRVLQLSPMWTPGAAFKNDADGTPVLGTWETPFFDTQNIGSQRWRDVYLSHDLRDAAADNPTWTLAYCTSPEPSAPYTTLSPALVESTMRVSPRVPVRRKSRGMGFKVTRQNASALARIYAIGATVYNREGSRQDV